MPRRGQWFPSTASVNTPTNYNNSLTLATLGCLGHFWWPVWWPLTNRVPWRRQMTPPVPSLILGFQNGGLKGLLLFLLLGLQLTIASVSIANSSSPFSASTRSQMKSRFSGARFRTFVNSTMKLAPFLKADSALEE